MPAVTPPDPPYLHPQPQPQLTALQEKNLEYLERIAKITDATHDKAAAYSKVIVGLGYAGLLAVWSGTKADLSQLQRVLSALLVLGSLMFYVIYEVIGIVFLGFSAYHLNSLVKKHSPDLKAALVEYGKTQENWTGRMRLSWIIVLTLTIPPGLGGAGVLIWAFVARLIQHH